MPTAKKMNYEQEKLVIKARFFGYMRDMYFAANNKRLEKAKQMYRRGLLTKAMTKLSNHKEESQLLAVAMAFRK